MIDVSHRKKTTIISLGICLMLLFVTVGTTDADILYAADGNGPLYEIDIDLQTVTQIGTDTWPSGPETTLDPNADRLIHSPNGAAGLRGLQFISPDTGAVLGFVNMTGLPAGTDTATALEMIGTTLYGSFQASGTNNAPGVLGTIDLNTGAVSTVGTMNGMAAVAGGLANAGANVYAVSSGAPNSALYTVDLSTGAATLVEGLTIGGNPTNAVSGLAFENGTMYALRSGFQGDTNLYSIDLATGVMTAEFDMGIGFNSLASSTVIPEPSGYVLLMLAGGFICTRRRRK